MCYWEETDTGFKFAGKELSDKAIVGTFDMQFVIKEQKLSGTWTPHNQQKNDGTEARKFTLKNATFKYDPVEAQYESKSYDGTELDKNTSLELLETADVENLTQPRIRMIRNLIFARHGYAFGNKDLRLAFEEYAWYVPYSNDVKAALTDVEKKNLALLKRYEQYADSHYDDFGR